MQDGAESPGSVLFGGIALSGRLGIDEGSQELLDCSWANLLTSLKYDIRRHNSLDDMRRHMERWVGCVSLQNVQADLGRRYR